MPHTSASSESSALLSNIDWWPILVNSSSRYLNALVICQPPSFVAHPLSQWIWAHTLCPDGERYDTAVAGVSAAGTFGELVPGTPE